LASLGGAAGRQRSRPASRRRGVAASRNTGGRG